MRIDENMDQLNPHEQSSSGGRPTTIISLLSVVSKRRTLIFFIFLVATIAGVIFSFLQPIEWESSALIEIGQIGQPGQAKSSPIESALEVAERIQCRTNIASPFMADVQEKLNARGIDPCLQVRFNIQRKEGRLIGVIVRGSSPEESRRLAEGIANEITRLHNEIMGPTVERMRKSLELQSWSVARLDELMTHLQRLILKKTVAGTERETLQLHIEKLVFSNMLDNIQQRHANAIAAEHDLMERLDRTRTYPTSARVVSSNVPVSTNRSRVIIAAALVGLLVGVFVSLLLDSGWRDTQSTMMNSRESMTGKEPA